MTGFYIRDDRGTLKAKIDTKVMTAITSRGGKWRPYKTNDTDSVCYEYTEDMKFNLTPFGIGLELRLWVGDKVIPY